MKTTTIYTEQNFDKDCVYPFAYSIRPKVNVISTSDGTARCASSSVSVDTNVSVAETDFSVDAFGFHIWLVLASGANSSAANCNYISSIGPLKTTL